MATKTKRITSQTIRENRGKDLSPTWENAANWTGEEFNRRYRSAMDWYRLEKTGKDLKPKVLEWMNKHGYTKADVDLFKKTKDSRCNLVMGSLAACLLKGMPESHAGFNEGRNMADYLKENIAKVLEEGIDDAETEDIANDTVRVPTIQERLREVSALISEDLDYAIDSYIENPDDFDPRSIKVVSLLRGKGAKPAHARFIKSYYERSVEEYNELLSDNCDPQLWEGYSHYGKRNIKKMYEFLTNIIEACDQIIGESKLNKKPRSKKVKPAEELVKKIKFKATDDRYSITSIPPAQIVGAGLLTVFNTKTRKLGIYISKDTNGLGVKGTSIVNFTEKSEQKTLRKPDVQLKEFKELNTSLRVQKWFDGIKTTGTALNGRLNQDIIILKVWK